MAKNKKLEQLSKEELIALLMKKDAKINTLEEELSHAKYVDESIIKPLLKDTLETVYEISCQLNKNIFTLDDILTQDFTAQFKFVIENLDSWVRTAKGWYYYTPFSKPGKDLDDGGKSEQPNTTDAEIKEAEDKVKQLSGSLKNNATKITRVKNHLSKAYNKYNESVKNPSAAGQAASDIMGTEEVPLSKIGKARSLGKAKKDRNPKSHLHAKSSTDKCSLCDGNVESIGTLRSKLFNQIDKSKELLKLTENVNDVCICSKCGHIHIAMDEKQNVPVIPNHQISCETCIELSNASYVGIPLNKVIKSFNDIHDFGKDIFYYSLHDYVSIYLKPLYDLIQKHAKEAQTIIADGTPFPCLAAQGKFIDKKVKEEIQKGNKVITHSKNYILTLTSTAYTDEKFCVYSFIDSRAKGSILTVLNDEFKFKNLITDSYAAYKSIVAEREQATSHQHCLVHFRREVIKSCFSKKLLDDLDRLTDDELLEKIKSEVVTDKVPWLLFSVLCAISKIFAYEALVHAPGDEVRKQRIGFRQGVIRKLMDDIDVIMTIISEDRVKLRGNTYVSAKSDPYADVCVYYMNQKAKLRCFIDNPDIEPSSNAVENCIRNISILRKNIYWFGSYEGIEDMTIIYSIFATARLNGITNITEYLKKYSHALYQYCIEKKWTEEYKNGKRLDRQIRDWNMKELSCGFDFEAWDLTKKF